MPPQLTPPGGGNWHIVLTLLTPALLALSGALASRCIGRRRGATTFALLGILAGGFVALWALRPSGALTAFESAPLGGLLRVGIAPLVTAFVLSAITAWRFHPASFRAESWRHAAWTWALRVALAWSLPLLALPLLWLGAEWDKAGNRLGAAPQHIDRSQFRIARIAVAVIASIPALAGGPAIWSVAGAMITALVVCSTRRGFWPWSYLAGTLAILIDVLLGAT